jgi:hypothetical protein
MSAKLTWISLLDILKWPTLSHSETADTVGNSNTANIQLVLVLLEWLTVLAIFKMTNIQPK